MKTIQIENLSKSYSKVLAVDRVSLEVREGEIFGFLGPNGAGKTTTIRCMMGFIRPDSGQIKILGRDAQRESWELKREIGFLAGESNLYSGWTPREHIELVTKIRGGGGKASELVSKFGLNLGKKVKNLSSGNKQKLGLILALMHEPKVLILDEPSAGLDPLLQRLTYEILREQAEKGVTIFMSSHDLDDVEKVCDRVCIIKEGRLASVEKISDLKKKRLYTIEVYFENRLRPEDFKISGAEVIEELSGGYRLNVKGDINPILANLSKNKKNKVKDIEIKRSSLEEIFLEFYR